MQDVVFDEATSADIPELIELLNSLFSIEKDFAPNADHQRTGLQLLLANADGACIKVARNVAGKAIGMVSAQLVVSTAQGACSAWIEDMVIAPDHRAQHIGKHLLQHALAWAKAHGATRAQLLVDLANDSALGYYQHLGWQATQLQARRVFL